MPRHLPQDLHQRRRHPRDRPAPVIRTYDPPASSLSIIPQATAGRVSESSAT